MYNVVMSSQNNNSKNKKKIKLNNDRAPWYFRLYTYNFTTRKLFESQGWMRDEKLKQNMF